MNSKHHKVGTGIAALITSALTTLPALEANAATRPSPDYKRPHPAMVTDAANRPSPDHKRPRPAVVAVNAGDASGGGVIVLNAGHMTSSLR